MMSVSTQIRCFCDECEYCETYCGYDDAYGARVCVSESDCEAGGDPEDLGCPRREEYLELLEEQEHEEAAEYAQTAD